MWNFLECAVQGRGHIKDNIPCQDKTYSIQEDEVYIIALADGAGSARYSHIGADSTVRNAAHYLSRNFDIIYNSDNAFIVKQNIINNILEELNAISLAQNISLKDLASTLLLVAVKGDNFIIFHIGDGVIGYLKDEELKIASHPENGEFANSTIFTTSTQVIRDSKIIKGNLSGIEGFVLMSDGSADSLYSKTQKKLAPIISRLMQLSRTSNREILELALLDSFTNNVRKKTLDDCSINMMSYNREPFEGFNKLSEMGQYNLLGLPYKNNYKKGFKNAYEILNSAIDGKTIDEIAQDLQIKPKYLPKKLKRLTQKELLIRFDSKYYTLITL
ncbi:hypothetical protein B9T19_07645 [Ignatzschineria sp. F8392]|uniref:PP2C family serine/threonine-protein phosphatase n=1 Tax=Ignatzschineria sp. F8392 TaxID=1980117 RepID=UPI000B99166A|nr:PP2C family serine/threonine-protein phosphatase [Ignatzschineria sp. F8392]OYQ78712.1 hypothetical protein B9T19_07645 [Ignatzschineria sp. F8392]